MSYSLTKLCLMYQGVGQDVCKSPVQVDLSMRYPVIMASACYLNWTQSFISHVRMVTSVCVASSSIDDLHAWLS